MTPIEEAVVLLHFQSTRADDVIARLDAREQAMIARVDRRAFAVDSERRARAVAVLTEELPVSIACVGVRFVFSFFDDDAFVSVVRGLDGLVPAAARWLEPQAKDCAVLEGAIARARRRRAPVLAGGEVALAAGVGVCRVRAGALEAWARMRASLGAAPHEAVAHGARAAWPELDAHAVEHVLVQGGAVSGLGEPLFDVLAACATPAPRSRVEDIARAHGASDDEARALVDELTGDGLLAAAPTLAAAM